MLEDLENRHENVGSFSQDSKRFLRTTSEDSIDTARAESIDDVLSETEGH